MTALLAAWQALKGLVWPLAIAAFLALSVYVPYQEAKERRVRDALLTKTTDALTEVRRDFSDYRLAVEAEARERSEAARETERLATRNNTRINDERNVQTAALADRAAALDRRLREHAAASATTSAADSGGAACSVGGSDAETPLELSGAARSDLVRLAADAERDAIDLDALQKYITNVCRPSR